MKSMEELRQMYDVVIVPEVIITVSKNGKWFHADGNGVPLYDARFDTIGTFTEDGHALVSVNGELFRINKKGENVEDELYVKEMREIFNEMAMAVE